ncbi:DegT/DnrJ/EryC1/StrS family aminotransferase [Candidatus Uabimicrobium amorphum]|uniref:GDP-perosamine synthase n=1 Tax=Uabimicrobium amorphum TaxID=2596890 RepID=A0A5S9F5W1_UABAM|nr:DegT/DnrJ/EryC1/StrS family aminotransferase [Candidatus Uabimicrobium amorphum]BBM87275.1 GDP-perosamine synthase [Candidatus Uabimicrobium amorphum]
MAKLAINGGQAVRSQPFSQWPCWDDSDKEALIEVLEKGSWGGYPAPNTFAGKFAEEFARFTGAQYGVCGANGSVTLEMAILAAGIEPGSEIIVPAYTFVATASAVVFCHAIPIFVDVDPHTYCIDPQLIEAAITPKTRAIIPVHLACNMADMDAIIEIAAKHNLVVIEDCAHAHGARWKGKGAGAIGDFGSFSFQTSKLMTAGEGGIVLTNDKQYEMRLQSVANCGRKEPQYEDYEGAILGKNYRITEWSAGMLLSQLKKLEQQTLQRIRMAGYFEEKLRGMPGISFTKQDSRNDRRAIYQFIVKYDEKEFKNIPRDRFLQALNADGIPAEGDFYVPLYDCEIFPMDKKSNPLAFLPYAKDYSFESFDCPVTERAAHREAIWLPHYLFLGTEKDMDDIVAAFTKIGENLDELA